MEMSLGYWLLVILNRVFIFDDMSFGMGVILLL